MATGERRIAVVDDEEDLRDAIVEYLTANGYLVSGFPRAADFRVAYEAEPFDLAILDIAMPGEDGLSLARWLKQQGHAGIIFATASATSIDRIVGLELGADDYVVKPYELRELLARVRSVLRRLPDHPSAAPAAAAQSDAKAERATARRIRFGGMALDLDALTLVDANGAPIDLTATELDLLMTLATRPGRALSRAQIVELAGGQSGENTERAIDIRVTRLRRKIEPNPDSPKYIRTLRGTGYVFVGD
jgi:DNA-binding response OmpR family regulator